MEGDSVTYGKRDVFLFGDILRKILKRKRFYEKNTYGKLSQAWETTVGKEVASHTRIKAYQNGILKVDVDSSVLLQELRGFLHRQILSELQATPGGEGIAEIVFRMGNIKDF
jgi:predicted nucleic acid-binding Zn ribbon protein